MIDDVSLQCNRQLLPGGRSQRLRRYSRFQNTVNAPLRQFVVITPAIIRTIFAPAVEYRTTATTLRDLGVDVHTQAVHLANFRATKTADSMITAATMRCNQLRASRRQLEHFTCHSGRTLPQYEHDQIIFGIYEVKSVLGLRISEQAFPLAFAADQPPDGARGIKMRAFYRAG